MKTPEVVVNIVLLSKQGLSGRQIAKRLGISRETVRKYLHDPDSALRGRKARQRPGKLDPYRETIQAWLDEDPGYKATWIYDRLVALGYAGSYDVVKRAVGAMKEERTRIAYLRFETEPGNQAQVDFGDFQVDLPHGSSQKYYLFSMILGYSRRIYSELVRRCDLVTFLDCHIRAFEFFGGVPREILYDRMRNAYLGKLAGRKRFNTSLVGLAIHYGFKPEVAPAYAAWVKGKVERPYSFIREGFWRGYGFTTLQAANRDLQTWLSVKEKRIHGTTYEQVCVRFERERPFLGALPCHAYDTSERLYRKVHKDCTVRLWGNSYVVCHTLVGKQVILRVKNGAVRIFHDDRLIVRYELASGRGHLVQDKRFYEALLKDRAMNARKYSLPVKVRGKGRARHMRPDGYEHKVQVRPVDVYQQVAEASL